MQIYVNIMYNALEALFVLLLEVPATTVYYELVNSEGMSVSFKS